MRVLRALTAVLIATALMTPATAGEGHRRCTDAGLDDAACEIVRTVEDALQRPGVSFEDFTATPNATVEIADFYFAPHVSVVRNGQTVSFRNTNAPGGNSHSVSSSDWGGSEPVLPIPVASFGGGAGFRSGKLGPGEPFTVVADINALDETSYVLLPNGDALVGYHCYIHGAAQMNGVLLVQGAAS